MPPTRPGRGRRKSRHASRPWQTVTPHSSATSRLHASHGVSPSASMTPPGIVQPALYVGLSISSLPFRSKIKAPADTGMAGTAATADSVGPVDVGPVDVGQVNTAGLAWNPAAATCTDSTIRHAPFRVPARRPDGWMAIHHGRHV